MGEPPPPHLPSQLGSIGSSSSPPVAPAFVDAAQLFETEQFLRLARLFQAETLLMTARFCWRTSLLDLPSPASLQRI